jgi:hypothetical protein
VTLSPQPAPQVLDTYFLEARSKLLDLAAILDRIDRGPNAGRVREDPRLSRIRQAIELMADDGPDRTAKVQELFSLPYDANWQRPTPR